MSKVINGQPYIYTGVYGLATEPVVINDKEEAVKLYVTQALCRTQSMFRYINLPDTIPQRSMELYIQTGGSCCIAEWEGNLYAFFGTFGGEPDVYYMPRSYIVANPALKMSKEFEIHKDCVVIPNDAMYMGLMPIFRRYATLLAENDVTLNITDINVRIMQFVTGNTDRDIASAEAFFEKVKKGEIGAAMSTPFMEGLKTQPFAEGSSRIITELIELQQYYKASMFNDIGLNSNYNMKRETIISAEIELNADALFPFVDNMLYCREKAIEEVNEMFGTDIRVELNSSWEDLADSREVQDVVEEAEALAAISVGDATSDFNQLEDMDSSQLESESTSETNEESVDEENAENEESDSIEEIPQQEEQTSQADEAIEEIKDVLIEKIADVVDDGNDDEPLEETVSEILDEDSDSSQLESEDSTEDSSQLENEEDNDAESEDEEEESE